ncbi:MAG: TIGR01459 family HAD-type hydrolase [Rhodospirillaceae bacterium]|nr:TIGR01459 family HAD-type hydrolase [Rhodospirillaceae bacterium]
MKILKINSFRKLIPNYDAFLIDIWGVIHGGGHIYPEVINCLDSILSLKKEIILLSNAPRRAHHVANLLKSKGLPEDICSKIVSSGEATRIALLEKNTLNTMNLGKNYFVIGPHSDNDLLNNTFFDQVYSLSQADFILAIGLNSHTTSIEEHRDIINYGIKKSLIMLCVNPDIEVVRLGKKELCAGALAKKYSELGGSVIYVGKPYQFIYDLCLNHLKTRDKKRVLCIGDGINTDILGARNAGLDSILITGGLIAGELDTVRDKDIPMEDLIDICRNSDVYPTAIMSTLRW